MDPTKRLLFWLLEGTKGGPTRIRLLKLLHKKPRNIRQLSLAAGLDYKTTEHHVDVLMKNRILEGVGSAYGRAYFISEAVVSDTDFKKILGVKK